MEDGELLNRIVFITVHADRWLRDANPRFNIPMANRLARVSKVFDWDTDEGRMLLEAREKSGKWGKLNSRDFKFVLSIFYPELIKDGQQGMVIEEVMPQRFPGTELDLFSPMPTWVLDDILKERKQELFKLEKSGSSRAKTVKKPAKRVARKSSRKKGKKRVSRRAGR